MYLSYWTRASQNTGKTKNVSGLWQSSSDYSGKLGTVFESLKTLAVFEFKIYHTDVSGSKKFWVLT